MNIGLTFDDVCLVPQFNNVASRGEPVLDTWITSRMKTRLPLIPANMDSVISPELSEALLKWSGDAIILHRFHKDENLKSIIECEYMRPVCVSWGVKDWDGLKALLTGGLDEHMIWGVCFDVAHGHCEGMFDIMDRTQSEFGDSIEIIAGNVCTPLGYQELVSHGATAVKVGVGCGAACTTRIVTGFGMPQFTAIRECATLARKLRVPIIADGGIRNSRDIVLALAAGASSVMMGKMFAACEESAAEKKNAPKNHAFYSFGSSKGAKKAAKYRGQASFDFQQEFYGECKNTPEGEAFWIPVTGSVDDLMTELIGSIKSGMTYAGAKTIEELQRKAEFMQVTSTYRQESEIRP